MLNANGERIMARVAKIDSVIKHPDADTLDICQVGGWKVVTRLGEFKAGELAVYCEPDSFVPTEIAPFLSKGKEPRVYQGISGEKLRTVKLRGVVSQGLLLPLDVIPGHINHWLEGDDCSAALGIVKYEPPIPTSLAGLAKGNFPGFLYKTDLERCQNLVPQIEQWAYNQVRWEVEEKVDGSSMTVYLRDGIFGVCSRNLELQEDDNNSFWRAAKKFQLQEKIASTGRNLALQLELVGNSIQKNPYKLTDHNIYLFDIYDIDAGQYLMPDERYQLALDLDINHAPIIHSCWEMPMSCSVEDLLSFAEGKSTINPTVEREGLAFKSLIGRITFKAVSNSFLLKSGG